MDSGIAERLAAIAVRDAARELAGEAEPLAARAYRTLARQIDAAHTDARADGRTLAMIGPSRRGESLISMILKYPGPDPVRTAKLLLRAIEWDDE